MSKGYIITAKTKGKEPKVLFLSKEFKWAYSVTSARICLSSSAKDAAKDEPTHCLFVEAKDELINALQDANKVDYNEFWQFIERFGCKTISTRKEKAKPKPEAKKRVGYVLYRELGGTRIYSCDTKITAWVNAENIIAAVRADVYETQQKADFAAYALNNYGQEFALWKVEQIEF